MREVPASTDSDLVKYLYRAGHHTPLEFAVIAMHITGVSRPTVMQLTRHRHSGFVVSSQHYQDYRDYPALSYTGFDGIKEVRAHYEQGKALYAKLVDDGFAPEQAREVLPASMACNLFMTANARQLAHILSERLCNRNTLEMRHLAMLLREQALDWFPELYRYVGPQCTMDDCRQGRMQCPDKIFKPIIGDYYAPIN